MSTTLILAVAVIYLGTSVSLLLSGQKGMALAFFAYAISNVGLALAVRGI